MPSTIASRFWSKVNKNGSVPAHNKDLGACWEWTRYVRPSGYAMIGAGGKNGGMLYAHRVSYEMHHGPIPTGYQIDHLCRNRRCVNPAHLEAVTQRENILRGNAPRVVLSRANVCARGHDLSGENAYWRTDRPGQRQCKLCLRIAAQRRREERRAIA